MVFIHVRGFLVDVLASRDDFLDGFALIYVMCDMFSLIYMRSFIVLPNCSKHFMELRAD